MKPILILILSFALSYESFGQSDSTYLKAQNGDIYYQRVVECPGMDRAEIKTMIKQSGAIRLSTQVIVDTDDRLVVNVAEMKSHAKEIAWYRYMSADYIYQEFARYKGQATYEIKDGKYRITLTEIAFRTPDTGFFDEYTYIRDLIYNKRKELRKRYDKRMIEALSYTFEKELAPAKVDPKFENAW